MYTCGCCEASIDEREQLLELSLFKCLQCGVYNRLPRRSYEECIKYIADSNPDVDEVREAYEKHIPLIKMLETYGKGKLYDVGCGLGGLLRLSKDRGWRSLGNDIRPEIVTSAKKHYNVTIQLGHFEHQALEINTYQTIVFHHGIEHVLYPKRAIEKAINILKSNGIIYLMHPCIPVDKAYHFVDKSNSVGGHNYEWSFEAFKYFINQFKQLKVLKSSTWGDTLLYPDIAPVQEWVLRKND